MNKRNNDKQYVAKKYFKTQIDEYIYIYIYIHTYIYIYIYTYTHI